MGDSQQTRPRRQEEVAVNTTLNRWLILIGYDEIKMKRRWWSAILIVIALGLLATAIYYFYQYRRAIAGNPTIEARVLAEKINKTVALPDEQPGIATVADKTKLTNSVLAAEAENGDKILLFSAAKKAVLYRPSTKKVIDIYPLDTSTAATAGTQSSLSIALYNTTTTDVFGAVESKISSQISGAAFPITASANRKNDKKTTVVDLSGTHATDAQQVASALGATIGTFPDGEQKPDADIVVIIGQDQH